jgi:uncharacterized protein YbjT (DUF2867 family)
MKTENLYAVTGITGQVGGVVARTLLEAGQRVRAVVRDESRANPWMDRGCEVALATMNDSPALAAAFQGAAGVFILLPPNFDPDPEFTASREMVAAICSALEVSRPERVVVLSTIGAQAAPRNLLSQLSYLEQEIGRLPLRVTFVRAAWFMENSAWDIAPARESGIVPSFLQPLDKPVPMVATADVGRVAAELLLQPDGPRVVELEGPRRITPHQVAETLAGLLARPVRMEAVPRETWDALFRSQGASNPEPRIRMLDGFNEGWIEFERGESGSMKGRVELEDVLRSLVEHG